MPRVIELASWSAFASRLARELEEIGFHGLVATRNFHLVTTEVDEETLEAHGEVDRLALVLESGTDRRAGDRMWNAPGFDYEHDLNPSGKAANEILYAHTVEVTTSGYLVHYHQEPEVMDVTEGLDEQYGVSIYDRQKLKRVALNEYWFATDPRDALLLVFILKQYETEPGDLE